MALDTAYRLGQIKAAEDLGTYLAGGIDNPTAPPAPRYTKTAIAKVIEKHAKKCKRKRKPPLPKYTPKKGTKFKAKMKRLRRKKYAEVA